MKKVTIIGAAIVDVLVRPAEPEVFKTGSYAAQQIKMTHGGDGLNEATVLRHLGAPVQLVTVLGSDEAGDSVLRRMEQVGLDTGSVQIHPELSTSVNVVLVQKDGQRCFLTDPHASQRQLRLEDITIPSDTGILCFASIFVFPHMKTAEMASLFRAAKAQGITVCADMTKRKNGETVEDIAPALQYIDYLFPNDAEAMLITGKETPEEAAEVLLEAGVGTVVVKCGARGCYVKRGDTSFWSPAVQGVTCMDTTGAGDSFVGGFLYGLAQELPLEDCVDLANRCGARAVEHIGATTWIAPQIQGLPFFLPKTAYTTLITKGGQSMIEQDTIKLLRECDAGIKMGISSIDDVLDYVSADALKQKLTACKASHEALQTEIQEMLDAYHDEGKDPNPMAKGMSWVKTNMKLAMNESDHTIADLMTDGCNMGVKSLGRYLNQYKAASERSKDITKRLIALEDQMAVDLRAYL